MAQIIDYASLVTAISSWDERDWSADADEIIGLAEAEFRLHLSPNYARESSVTLAIVSGSVALPAGYIRALALTHATYGALNLKSIGVVRLTRINNDTGIPDIYAVTGSTIEVAPTYTGNLTFDYEGTLAGLSGSNTTNWLILNAPQAYLAMCMSVAKAKMEDFEQSAVYEGRALKTLSDLGIQSAIGQFSGSSMTIRGATP